MRKLVEKMEGTHKDPEFTPMSENASIDMLHDEFPALNEDELKMAYILTSLADVEMGEEFVFREGSPVRKTYEQYKIWRGLKGE